MNPEQACSPTNPFPFDWKREFSSRITRGSLEVKPPKDLGNREGSNRIFDRVIDIPVRCKKYVQDSRGAFEIRVCLIVASGRVIVLLGRD